MKNTEIQKLQADSDWCYYLLANGWTEGLYSSGKTNYGNYEAIIFYKEDHRGKWYLRYESCEHFGSSFYVSINKGERVVHTSKVECNFIEELDKFMLIAHALGWVTFQEAFKNCKQQTGIDLKKSIYEEINSGACLATPQMEMA